MKYLITEKQLKTLKKYMKSFINENDMDSYIQGDNDPRNPANKSYEYSEDDNISIVNVTHNGRKIAKITIDFDNNEFYINTNNQNIENDIETKLQELKDAGMLDSIADNDTIAYQELMSED
jgi:hypothetical protein